MITKVSVIYTSHETRIKGVIGRWKLLKDEGGYLCFIYLFRVEFSLHTESFRLSIKLLKHQPSCARTLLLDVSSLSDFWEYVSLPSWVRPHINGLESVKCTLGTTDKMVLLELL